MVVDIRTKTNERIIIVCVHLDPASATMRSTELALIKDWLTAENRLRAAVYVLGDFNYVTAQNDRLGLDTYGEYTVRAQDHTEEREACKHADEFFLPLAMHELRQDTPTYVSAALRGAARLDRVYTNQHPADQLTFDYYAFCLRTNLSDHSPVIAGKRAFNTSKEESELAQYIYTRVLSGLECLIDC